jgi:hypothetical protein
VVCPVLRREMMQRTLIGICGDNCRFCPRYISTRKGDEKELEKVKALWVKLGLRDPDFPATELACYGCKPDNDCAYRELRDCADNRGVASCGLCAEYPCTLVQTAFDRSEELHSRLAGVCTLREIGILEKAFSSKRQNLDQIHREIEERER